MPSAALIRHQIEARLAQKIPSALTPATRTIHPVVATGIEALDAALGGGLPVGAISELTGPSCSGKTSAAMCFLAGITQAGKVCAWVDVSDAFDPASAAAAGIDLQRLLWVRCGRAQRSMPRRDFIFRLPEKYLAPPRTKRGLHGGGCGGHPRNEAKGLPEALDGLLRSEAFAPRCAEPQRRERPAPEKWEHVSLPVSQPRLLEPSRKPWSRMEQALRATDLLLQAGGFSALVLDMGSMAPEHVSRVPLATWFRYRAAAERTQSSIVLLTQYSCAKSSAELLLQLQPAQELGEETTVFPGMRPRVEVVRRRFATNVVPLRKPPQSAPAASWRSSTLWAGRR